MPHKRRSSDPNPDTVVVITGDGTRLRCSLATIARESEPRWMIVDDRGLQYVGPLLSASSRDRGEFQRLIEQWWATRATQLRGDA
jgi:hypothetical protein